MTKSFFFLKPTKNILYPTVNRLQIVKSKTLTHLYLFTKSMIWFGSKNNLHNVRHRYIVLICSNSLSVCLSHISHIFFSERVELPRYHKRYSFSRAFQLWVERAWEIFCELSRCCRQPLWLREVWTVWAKFRELKVALICLSKFQGYWMALFRIVFFGCFQECKYQGTRKRPISLFYSPCQFHTYSFLFYSFLN